MKKMIKKRVLLTILAVVGATTLAYAGIRSDYRISLQGAFEHPALDELAVGYQAYR